MLMAAGLGTRLRPFTDREPKAFLPLLGVPMAQFSVDALAEAGVSRLVVNVHHHTERACAALAALDLNGARATVSDESSELLGSAGGIQKARSALGDRPFFLLNADVICDVDLRALALRHASLRDRWGVWLTLAIFRRSPLTGTYREIFVDEERGLITGTGDLVSGRPFFVGAAILEAEALGNVPPAGPAEFVPTILKPAIQAGRAGAYLAQGAWFDIGSPALWFDAHRALIERLETGALSRRWRHRIERGNRRKGNLVWLAKDSARMSTSGWQGPAYWNPAGDSQAWPPKALGPNGFLYGTPLEENCVDGIGYHGTWVKIPRS